MRLAIPARPEQSQSPVAHHPLFAQAGRHAAQLWLQSAPMTMADFRDLRFRNLIAGTGTFPDDEARRQAFNIAFVQEIARSVAQHSRMEVQHG